MKAFQAHALHVRWSAVGVFVFGLLLLFWADLLAWLQFGLNSSLYSYTLLIPPIALFMQVNGAWRELAKPPSVDVSRWLGALGIVFLLGAVLGMGRWEPGPLIRARLALLIVTVALAALFWRGLRNGRARLFPAMFLFLSIPLSAEWEQALSGFLQHWSGWLSFHLIRWSGTPIVRDGPYLWLPNLNLEVAEECSGIRSTLVLMVTSLLAAKLFLRLLPTRLALVAMVIPLGILRNAIRIWVISMLTLYVDPNIIYGPLHRRGGPLFFVLSLVLFFAWLLLLRKGERLVQLRKEGVST